jgi:acyl transferase domain-containing protein
MSTTAQGKIPLAIIGMSCRLPGATNLDEFWQLIVSGRDATGELPEDVLDRELYYDPRIAVVGKSYSAVGGLVPRLPFDNEKCRLPEDVIKAYDVAHLTACEVASDALRDASYDPFDLPTRNVGVYLGHTGGSTKAGDIVYSIYIEQTARYLHEVKSLGSVSPIEIERIARQLTEDVRERCDHRVGNAGFDASANNCAALIARAFGLDGPCVVVDAACASSLQALAIGARALQLGQLDMAVVGGASFCKSDSLVLFSQAQSVSASKSCPFDENATGLVTAEGFVTLILKTLPKALADGDRIRCVIRSVGMSADGRGKSLWAPRKQGQIVAMQRAYSDSLRPEDIQYIEAHATSTQVGDATELAALGEFFPQQMSLGRKIPLGSVKGNIGHTLETAGVAGLLKTVLAMEHGVVPPVANLSQPNSTVPWENLPFYLPTKAEPWHRPSERTPRRAAVNSFGIGGLNVHVVVEEYLPELDHVAATPAVSDRKEPIAVVGVGAILPGAKTVEAFWELLASGKSALTEVSADRWDSTLFYDPTGKKPYRSGSRRGGFITDYHYDWRRHKVPPKQVANANPLQFMLLDATEQALAQAGYLERPFDRDRFQQPAAGRTPPTGIWPIPAPTAQEKSHC